MADESATEGLLDLYVFNILDMYVCMYIHR